MAPQMVLELRLIATNTRSCNLKPRGNSDTVYFRSSCWFLTAIIKLFPKLSLTIQLFVVIRLIRFERQTREKSDTKRSTNATHWAGSSRHEHMPLLHSQFFHNRVYSKQHPFTKTCSSSMSFFSVAYRRIPLNYFLLLEPAQKMPGSFHGNCNFPVALPT